MNNQNPKLRFFPGLIHLSTLIVCLLFLFCIGSQCLAAQVTLAWDASTQSTVAGYKLYYGAASRNYSTPIDVGNVTQYTLIGIPEDINCFFAVTAYDSSRNESAFSPEVFYSQSSSLSSFNNDDKPDILWRNISNGQICVWFMDEVCTGGAFLPTVPDTSWVIVGKGDFNSDGKTDILWRNNSTGQNYVWLMDGLTCTGEVILPSAPDPSWAIVSTGDFNSDGKTDILWRNNSNGENAVWYMYDIAVAGWGYLPAVSDPSWAIVSTGDFNSDGKADILWRNNSNGQDYLWYMDGSTYTEGVFLPTVVDPNWIIV